ELTEAFELPRDLVCDRVCSVRGDNVARTPLAALEHPLAEIDVQAEPERGWRLGRTLLGRGPAHHQARARHDAAQVRLEDAAIDAGRAAEVVGVDDEMDARLHRLRSSSSAASTRSAAKYSSAISAAARL